MRRNCRVCRMAKELREGDVIVGIKCLITGISHYVHPLSCNLCIIDEDIEAALKEAEAERKKDVESNPDEVNSLDSTIDECFREMERLIEGVYFSRTTRHDELETARATIKKLTGKNKANKGLIASMEEAISSCLGPYDRKEQEVTNQLAALKVCNKKLSKDNEDLRDENKILQQELAFLKNKIKKCSTDFSAVEQENSRLCMELDMIDMDLAAHKALNMALEVTLSRTKEHLSGKWRLLEVGEKPQKGDQAFLIDTNNVRIWVEPDRFTGTVKEGSVPVRRKITI